MVISIKRIILILLSVFVGVFTALNFAYPLKIRLGLAVVLTLSNVIWSLYALDHWRYIFTSHRDKPQSYWELGFMELVYIGYLAMGPDNVEGVLGWIWLVTSNLCFVSVLGRVLIVSLWGKDKNVK